MTIATTPKFGIALMSTGSLQKELIFNEASILLEVLTARSVKSKALNQPPASPAAGDTYLITDANPIGAWAGKSGQIAFWYNGWRFVTPPAKMKVWDEASSTWWTFSGGLWVADAVSAVHTLDDLSDVTIGTPVDGQVLAYDVATHQWSPKTGSTVVNFGDLADVDTAGLQNGQVFVWDAATSTLKPADLPVFPEIVTYDHLAQMQDLDLSGLVDGNMLVWQASGGKWVPGNPVVVSLDNINDVVTSGAQVGDVLTWNGAAWGPSSQAMLLSFLNVVDGPRTYEGAAHKLLRVDATESELEYVDPAEIGVPAGGTEGQVLVKGVTGSAWADAPVAVPVGGTSGQVLAKASNTDGDVQWVDEAPGVTTLDGLTDVASAGATDTQVLAFNSTSGNWEPRTVLDGTPGSNGVGVPVGGTAGQILGKASGTDFDTAWVDPVTGGATAINDLSDVDTATAAPTIGDVLKWDGTNWVPGTTAPGGIDALTDVDTSTAAPTVGQTLVWNGTNWVPGGTAVLSLYASSTFTAGELLTKQWVAKGFTLPVSLTGSYASLEAATTGAIAFTIKKNGASVGTVNFAAGATTGTFTFAAATAFSAGDSITITAPASADATAAGLAVSLKGSY